MEKIYRPQYARSAQSASLKDKLSKGDNSLNLVRFVLASLVIFGHAFPLGGFTPLQVGNLVLGAWHGTAVECFFVISGFLIFKSALRLNWKKYLWRRFLRIYPGYILAIFITGFIISPLGALLGSNWKINEALYFFFKSLTLKSGDLPINADVPWPATWNGSLWTLFYEALAYAGVLIFTSIPILRRNLKFSVILLSIIFVSSYLFIPQGLFLAIPGSLGGILHAGIRLWAFFSVGMLFLVFADKIPSNLFLSIVSVIISLFIISSDHGLLLSLVAIFSLSYSVLGLGASLRPKFFIKNDISYGIYVYAFPIQQILVLAGVNQYGWLVTSISCFLATIPVAWLSWKLVEEPALKLKSLV